jgi:hypothetical protein
MLKANGVAEDEALDVVEKLGPSFYSQFGYFPQRSQIKAKLRGDDSVARALQARRRKKKAPPKQRG